MDTVQSIDPQRVNVVYTYATGAFPRAIAFDGSNIWIVNSNADTVSKFVL